MNADLITFRWSIAAKLKPKVSLHSCHNTTSISIGETDFILNFGLKNMEGQNLRIKFDKSFTIIDDKNLFH